MENPAISSVNVVPSHQPLQVRKTGTEKLTTLLDWRFSDVKVKLSEIAVWLKPFASRALT